MENTAKTYILLQDGAVMANLLSRFILFMSSYIPLWVIFAIMTVREQLLIAIIFSAIALISLVGTLAFMRIVQGFQGVEIRIGIIRRKDSDTMSYIASYLIPFAATSFDKTEQVISLTVFLVVLCVVYVNSGMIHINPMLSSFGYNLFEVEDNDGNPYFLISRNNLRRGQTVKAIDLAESIFVEKNK